VDFFILFLDYNEKALTFTNRVSYLKKIYVKDAEGSSILRGILRENLLINIRTYDAHALILYSHDNFNNFVHLYIIANEVVYLYNYGNEIVNLTVSNKELNSGKSIQIAVIRTGTSTTLHVNEHNATLDKGVLLLEEYSNKPWVNPELEVLSPHRPPAPTVSYFQLNLAGYDQSNLLRANNITLDGLVGCVRGLKIGGNLIDLPDLAKNNEAHEKEGVLADCQMYCDAEPCKNGGICTENFAKQDVSTVLCNCEHTSFLGEFCIEDKGAEFSGESGLQRKYVLVDGKIDQLKLQLAFSSGDLRRANRVMLLLQTDNPTYYLMVGVTTDGHLFFEEDRNGEVYSATIQREFLNNARHSVYFKR
jgi:Laminin G domain